MTDTLVELKGRIRARMADSAGRDWSFYIPGGIADDLRALLDHSDEAAARIRELEALVVRSIDLVTPGYDDVEAYLADVRKAAPPEPNTPAQAGEG